MSTEPEYTNKQFKIISDGTTDGTTLIGPDGNVVGMCDKLVWEADGQSPVTKLHITLVNVPIEVRVPEEQVVIDKLSVQDLFERAKQFAEAQ